MIESSTEKLLVQERGHTLLITINNPPANTWDTQSLEVGYQRLLADLSSPTVTSFSDSWPHHILHGRVHCQWDTAMILCVHHIYSV